MNDVPNNAKMRTNDTTKSKRRKTKLSAKLRRQLNTIILALSGVSALLWIASYERKNLKKATAKWSGGYGNQKGQQQTSQRQSNIKWQGTPAGQVWSKTPPGQNWPKNTAGQSYKKATVQSNQTPWAKRARNANKQWPNKPNGKPKSTASITMKSKDKVENTWANVTISLIGERNTGTNWIISELRRCFPNHQVKPRLIRYKHWFQQNDGHKHKPTVVVAQFRNPYEWIEAMRRVPLHAPNHMYLNWKTFISKPWGMDRPKRDIVFKEKGYTSCFEGFSYEELVSCVEGDKEDEEFRERLKVNPREYFFSGHKPVYELNVDKSGEPYPDILKFRAAKILNFLSVKDWDWVEALIPVRYESLLLNGTKFLIQSVEEALKVKSECIPMSPQLDRRRRNITKSYVEQINERLDWDVEKMIGYNRGDFILDSQVIVPKLKSSNQEIDEDKVVQSVNDNEESNKGNKIVATKIDKNETKADATNFKGDISEVSEEENVMKNDDQVKQKVDDKKVISLVDAV